MRIIVDSNIVFSTLLNTKSNIGQILLTGGKYFDFFSTNLLKEEIIRHKNKILKIAKLEESTFQEIFQLIQSKIRFIDESLLTNQELEKAQNLVKHIDVNDTLFVALSQNLKAHIWTGDKVLI